MNFKAFAFAVLFTLLVEVYTPIAELFFEFITEWLADEHF
jgi:hypothetical protein